MKLLFNHLIALAAFACMALKANGIQSTNYNVHEQNSLQQIDGSSFAVGYSPVGGDFVNQFSLVSSIDTGGASLSAAPILGGPNGLNVTFPSTGAPSFAPTWATGNGYNQYSWGGGWTSQALLNSAYGSGTFTLTLGDATVTPTLSLNTANPVYPISPMLLSGGTWSGGNLLVDPSTTTLLTFNTGSFTGYSTALGAQIKFELVDAGLMPISAPSVSQHAPSLNKNDPALTSYTIVAGTLVAGQTYNFQANYTQFDAINTTPFTGTGISGNPIGGAGYLTTTFISIQAVPEPSTWAILTVGAAGFLVLRRRK